MGMWNVVATPWSVQSVGSQVYNFFSDRLGELNLAPDVKQAFDKARQDISSMEMIRRTSAAVRKLRYGDATEEILQLLDIGQFQHANHVMQPLLTAMPEYRKLYNQKMAAGFENGYSQHDAFRGSAYMHTDENYREVTDGMLNQVELAIRAYDPCLSCATQAMGKMPLKAELYNHNGQLIDERFRN